MSPVPRVRDRARKQLASHYTFSAMTRSRNDVIMLKLLFSVCPENQRYHRARVRRPASHSYPATRINWLHFREKSARAFIIADADTARTFAHGADNLRPSLFQARSSIRPYTHAGSSRNSAEYRPALINRVRNETASRAERRLSVSDSNWSAWLGWLQNTPRGIPCENEIQPCSHSTTLAFKLD